MSRSRNVPVWWVACLGALLLDVADARAQLRPIEPIEWSLLEQDNTFSASAGLGVLFEQRASLAGTEGTLLEVGNFAVAWRAGRISLELAGTLSRRFTDKQVFRAPSFGANPPDGQPRRDAGDIRASTLVRLAGDGQTGFVVLRFGTRLPTTSEESGLDRDRTDFFASIAGRWRHGALAVSGESGLGIFGTRIPDYDQSDVFTYSAGLEYDFGPFTPSAWFLGHQDGTPRIVIGNEDLRELRLGVRAGHRRWLQATLVRGFAEFSPGAGLLLAGGITI
jgi:hypothetical protein